MLLSKLLIKACLNWSINLRKQVLCHSFLCLLYFPEAFLAFECLFPLCFMQHDELENINEHVFTIPHIFYAFHYLIFRALLYSYWVLILPRKEIFFFHLSSLLQNTRCVGLSKVLMVLCLVAQSVLTETCFRNL